MDQETAKNDPQIARQCAVNNPSVGRHYRHCSGCGWLNVKPSILPPGANRKPQTTISVHIAICDLRCGIDPT